MISISLISWSFPTGSLRFSSGTFAGRKEILIAGGLLTLVLCMGASSTAARAQAVGTEQSRYGRAAVYRYAEPDDVTIRVNVWGTVQNAGIYEVPRDARLSLLLSAAGGPQIGVRQRVDDQTLILELIREGEDGSRQVVYEQTMEGQITMIDENVPLQDGDVLTINSYVTQGVNWRDALSIGSSLVTLGITILSFATR